MTAAAYNENNQLTTWGSTELSYDLNGNLLGDGVNAYTWNGLNQLIGLSGPGLSAKYQYDGLGRRIKAIVNGKTTKYLYDGANVIQERTGARRTNLLTGPGIDEYFARTDKDGTQAFLTDILGSTVALVGASGVSTEYTYEPFGATTASGAASPNAFQFTGRENDGTGLYYYRARYYSPTWQRFISEDPIGDMIAERTRCGA